MSEPIIKRQRVVIVGGTGVFGSRLARLLVRDGHDVWIAARHETKAARLADEIGATALALDLNNDLAPLTDVAPNVIVDAAGPFQAYDAGAYRLARFAIEHGWDYIDLADDAAFCAGITELDAAATAAGSRVISGASSVPGLSSAVVEELAGSLDGIKLIETAILPGNRAPRGAAVIHAILAQVGSTRQRWRGGQWVEGKVWSDRRVYELMPGDKRSVHDIPVPDVDLFPKHFGARSVIFRAGMELGVLNRAVSVMAWLKRVGLLPPVRWLVEPARRAADLLKPFGTDHGGMIVDVVGGRQCNLVQHRWRLVAQGGDGPYIPTVTVRALLRRRDQIETGARPCLSEVPLDELEAAMSDLAITTSREERPFKALFAEALGEHWHALAPEIRDLHTITDREVFHGQATVTRGQTFGARFIAWLFGFPPAGEAVPVTVTIERRNGDGETWERNFGGKRFRSHLTAASPGHVTERFGPFSFELGLLVENGDLVMRVRRGWLLGVPLLRAFLPRSDAREAIGNQGRFTFDVPIEAPLGLGLVVHYRGWLKRELDEI